MREECGDRVLSQTAASPLFPPTPPSSGRFTTGVGGHLLLPRLLLLLQVRPGLPQGGGHQRTIKHKLRQSIIMITGQRFLNSGPIVSKWRVSVLEQPAIWLLDPGEVVVVVGITSDVVHVDVGPMCAHGRVEAVAGAFFYYTVR